MLFRYGKFTANNLIHLVLDSPHDLQPTLWYICEFHSWRNSENWPVTRLKSSSPSSFSQERDDAVKKNLAQREKDLAQREKTLAYKEKNLAQKETLLQQKLLRAELREREALEFEQEAKIKLEELDEKEQELEAEKLALQKNKNKNKYKGTTTSSIPTHHDAENADDDENPTNNENNNQWLLRFSNLQQRLEIAYREIENLRRPVSSAAETTTTTTNATATANGDDDNNNNDNNNGYDDDNNENSSSSIIISLQHELKLTKENAQKQKEENVFLWEKLKEAKNIAFSEQNVSSLKRSKMDVDNLDVDNNDEASSVGNRWAPLNFRVERMRRGRDSSAMMMSLAGRREREEEEEGEEGIVGMIEMQKEFRFLGRLR